MIDDFEEMKDKIDAYLPTKYSTSDNDFHLYKVRDIINANVDDFTKEQKEELMDIVNNHKHWMLPSLYDYLSNELLTIDYHQKVSNKIKNTSTKLPKKPFKLKEDIDDFEEMKDKIRAYLPSRYSIRDNIALGWVKDIINANIDELIEKQKEELMDIVNERKHWILPHMYDWLADRLLTFNYQQKVSNQIKDTSKKLPFKPFKLKEGFEEKEKITKDDITLEYFSSRNTDDNYKVVFEVNIKREISNPDQASLRNAIKDKLKYLDKKYMVLKEFNSKRATFHFDDDLWMEDATKDITPETIFSEFSKVFNFKVELPDMVKKDETDFQDFIIRRFKKYLYSTSVIRKWFRQFFPKGIRNAISNALPERFIYKYSYENNSMTMKLRTFWILALTYGVGEALKYRKKVQKVENTEVFFFDKVRENMSEADENIKEFFKE
jgi:hypothetical protein